jgi:glutathione S-transferase
MKLYFSPGACSFSPHIVLRELGYDVDLERVDFATKKTKSGEDFMAVNPKGYVPALKLDGGEVLTEGPAIVQYLADQKPEGGLAPKNGTIERVRLQEWLNFITSELHKAYTPLFSPKTPEEHKATVKETLAKRIGVAAAALDKHPYLMGEGFSVADAYLFTVLAWSKHVGVELAAWSSIVAFMERVGSRPSVKAAKAAEHAAK